MTRDLSLTNLMLMEQPLFLELTYSSTPRMLWTTRLAQLTP